MDDREKRQLIEELISEIQIYSERQPNGQWLKSIKFRLPIIEEDMNISLDNEQHVETRDVLQGMVRLARSMTLDALCNSDAEDKTPLVDEIVDDEYVDDEYEDTITIPVPLEAFGDAGLLGKDLHIQVIDGAVVITEDTDDE